MLPIVRTFETEPHVLYHVSPKLFEFPCRNEIVAARAWSQWHKNGVLGLWASTYPKMCSNFGGNVYRITMKESARKIGLPFGPFQKLTSALDEFEVLIDFLCKEGDVAYLIDARKKVGEVIVLNFDAIAGFENVTGTELFDIDVPLTLNGGDVALLD